MASKPPPAPDYVGAAKAQGGENVKAAIASGKINNPNVINPYGTQRVTWKDDIPTITQRLSKDQQRLLDLQEQGQTNLGRTGVNLTNQAYKSLSTPVSFDGLPDAPVSSGQQREDVIDAMMARVKTDISGQRDAKASELIAAGLRPGSRAWEAAMTGFDRQYNDAQSNAVLAGGQEASRDFGLDMQSRQQAISELLTKRQLPLNEINAILSGVQVQSPFSGGLGYQAGQGVQGAPIANAINNQGQAQQNIYNQQQASRNQNIGAGAGLLGSLGSAWIQK